MDNNDNNIESIIYKQHCIEGAKKRILQYLFEIESDIVTLQNNIGRFRTAVAELPDEMTEKEISEFDDKYDIEQGLKHIELF